MTRIAMVGLGQWGPNLLRNLRANHGVTVSHLCDLDEKRLQEFASLCPDATQTRNFSAVLNSSADAVLLATPAGSHEAQVEAALLTGKDVFVEKPLAMTLKGASRLVRLARDRGRVLMVGHTFLFNPAVNKVRELLAAGTLGRLQFILAQRMSLGRIRDDCNALWNLAPHDVSILLHWIGAMPLSVSAHGLPFFDGQVQEDVAFCTLQFPGRVLATIQVSWLAPLKVREMTVVGSERMLRYDDVNTESSLTLFHRGATEVPQSAPDGSFDRFRLQVRHGGEEPIPIEHTEPLAVEIAEFLRCLSTRETPAGSGDDALRITSVLEALDRSLKSGGMPCIPTPI